MSKIPHLLSSHIALPDPDSLTLLTGVLNANTNWLLLRYLYTVFAGPTVTNHHGSSFVEGAIGESRPTTNNENVKVVFVSWMREWEFWKSEARRVVGLDLAALQKSRRIAFVDGLTSLFADTSLANAADPAVQPTHPGRSPSPSFTQHSRPSGATPGEYSLTNPSLAHVSSVLDKAMDDLVAGDSSVHEPAHAPSKILLMLDSPSLILQTTTPPITATSLLASIMVLRSRHEVHSTVISVPADGPLLALQDGYGAGSDASFTASLDGGVGAATGHGSAMRSSTAPSTPLEIENAAFVVGLAHQSSVVLGCRMLGTGFAEDVSGVIRATRGGGYVLDRPGAATGPISSGPTFDRDEGEWLYYINRDGSAKVWRRGGLDA